MFNFFYSRVKSIANAFRGIKLLITTQVNARIHLIATLLVIGLGWYFKIAKTEWVLAFLAMGAVWSAEALNTAIEWLVNKVYPDYEDIAGRIKDIAAGGVLLASIIAAIIGLIIFVPKF